MSDNPYPPDPAGNPVPTPPPSDAGYGQFPPPPGAPPAGSWGAPPPPQQWAPPPAGGYQQYGSPMAAAVNPYESKATTVLILGILSLVLCQLLGPVAMVMGNNLKRESEQAGWPEPGSGKAGRICGIVATVLMVLGILFFAFFLVLGVSTSTTSSY